MRRIEYSQSQFILYEIVLPYCTVCTPRDGLEQAWHTPVTCEESSDEEYRLWIASKEAPTMITQPSPSIDGMSVLNSSIFKCVTSSSESTAKLKGGEGLASRGTMSIRCGDFDGDPGPINFSDKGTFFGKLMARNVLDGKKIITHYYSVVDNGGVSSVYEVDTSTHFITNTGLSNGVFSLEAKDALKDVEKFSQKFPLPSEVTLTADIDSTTTSIPVSSDDDFAAGDVFRIDDELFYVNSSSSNMITVAGRGSSLSNPDGTRIFQTRTDSHSADSTVQKCYVMNKKPLQDVLSDLFIAAELDDFIDYAQWSAEISEWNANAFLYGVFSEPVEINKLLDEKLRDYLVDMWLDQPSQKAVISAVTAWKRPIKILEEGNDLSSLKIKTSDNTRFSRALIYNTKKYQAESDEVANYSKLTLFTDTETETSDFYGAVKLKDFEFSNTISSASAQILCSRFVQRYSRTPKQIDFEMEERKLTDLGLGDIVDIVSRDSQTADGSLLTARDRCQIIKIQPNFNDIGRKYKVSALAYVPLIASNPDDELVITLTGNIFDENLYARAGAPNIPINVTFIFDGCTIGSTAQNIPAVRAGLFPSGSRIKIICINNTKWSAIGGSNFNAVSTSEPDELGITNVSLVGEKYNGGDSYQSDGIESEIYLNYGTVNGYVTSAEMYAAGGAGRIYGNFGAAILSGGGSGIPSGKGGENVGTTGIIVNGNDGTFTNGGAGGELTATDTAKAGDGGFSVNGEIGFNTFPAYSNISERTLAGGAFKGSNVTVYNLAAQSSKLRDGNSDAYTLITS